MRKISFLLILSLFPVFILTGADSFKFSSDRTSAALTKGKERTVLTGNAVIISGATTIRAERIELYGTDFRYANCYGKVKVTDTEKGLLITCESLFFDRIDEVTRIDGWVEMIDLKNEIVAKAGFMENFGKDDIAVLQIGVRILKEDMACRSEYARYRREEDILELSGMPVVYWKDDEYRASRIIINLETDEITLEGEVTGLITSGKEKEAKTEEAE